jgi:CPA2 family monovalent cation:H+ antiporter-2
MGMYVVEWFEVHHDTDLIITIAASFGLALVLGFAAVKLRLPVLVGYMVAGIILGPMSHGFVADVALSHQLAEIGVILLMFGVGLHFKIEDLVAVRHIALPGALIEIPIVTAMGAWMASGWGNRAAVVVDHPCIASSSSRNSVQARRSSGGMMSAAASSLA